MKLLFWFAVWFMLTWLIRGKKKSAAHTDSAPSFRKTAARNAGEAEMMVQCVHCDMHLPESEAISNSSGDLFCGEEHRRKHVSR